VIVVEPAEGDVACGEHGQGKLASISTISRAVETVLQRSQKLKGKKVLITSGPTQEPIDSVRFLSNRSSGKMGTAVARAALLMGADVTLITGPTTVPAPLEAKVIRVQTTQEMLREVLDHSENMDLIIGAAAVADYRPAHPATGKMRRSSEAICLELVPNPDVIAEVASYRPQSRVVGFAAEPDEGLEEAVRKIERKGLYAIAANNVGNSAIGFDSDENELTLIGRDGNLSKSGRLSKLGCALWLLERVAP
jgi:phosphopantothenoylcysteine decarboxylase/phosphopantothenate--cysteine ligase